ncbi:hypothetical protein GGR51DRAFT_577178 [Nemania sp. FL0031]|nr:hypothetical protein GGR51DRAFT_577178 [Nemania sp. FL0031]
MESLDRSEIDMDDVFLRDNLGPTIAEHATQCHDLFHKYMIAPNIVLDPTIMEDQLGRFRAWASEIDVWGPPNVSLDFRLRFSPVIVDIIHQLLGIICDILTSLEPIGSKRQRLSEHDAPKTTRRSDEYGSNVESEIGQAEENISKITYIIGGTVTRLFGLSNVVRKSAKANRDRKMAQYKDNEEANKAIAELRLYTECYIRSRFPMAPDWLRSALVEANAKRLQRLYYQRSHRRRIPLSFQCPQNPLAAIQLPEIDESALIVPIASSLKPEPTAINRRSKPANPPVPLTNTTTAQQTAVGALHDRSTTEVPRPKSILLNSKLTFPPTPPTHECPYCGVVIEFGHTSKSMVWQTHVIGDLEPLICILPHCSQAGQHGSGPLTFETSEAWINHMQNDHGDIMWECRAPIHGLITFDEEIQHQEHTIKEHGVPKMRAGALSSMARRSIIKKVSECPFGDDFQPPDKTKPIEISDLQR